jgi:toxin-antitoxin system, antitoxin component, xre domain protein
MKYFRIYRKITTYYRKIAEELKALLKIIRNIDIIRKKRYYYEEGDCMSYSAIDIAKWFLNENRSRMNDEDSDYITHLKLQKLLYYAQGCYLAVTGEALFDEDLLAWEHGPVVSEVYQIYKSCGSHPIEFNEDYDNNIDDFTQGVLHEVFDVFGQYSAWKLRQMTHDERPWKETARNGVINKNLIRDYFLKEYIE